MEERITPAVSTNTSGRVARQRDNENIFFYSITGHLIALKLHNDYSVEYEQRQPTK
jgi:hypothetical protein